MKILLKVDKQNHFKILMKIKYKYLDKHLETSSIKHSAHLDFTVARQ